MHQKVNEINVIKSANLSQANVIMTIKIDVMIVVLLINESVLISITMSPLQFLDLLEVVI
jgi:hypothetical protein